MKRIIAAGVAGGLLAYLLSERKARGLDIVIPTLELPEGWDFACPLDAPYDRVGGMWGDPRMYRANSKVPDPIHMGLDWGAPDGTPVKAIGDGEVIETLDDSATSIRGQWLMLSHANGLASSYVHLSERIAPMGAKVKKGDVIALSGHSGFRPDFGGDGKRREYKPHLHTTLRANRIGLKLYRDYYGEPHSGFGPATLGYYSVPGEPLIPGKYSRDRIEIALDRGVAHPRGL